MTHLALFDILAWSASHVARGLLALALTTGPVAWAAGPATGSLQDKDAAARHVYYTGGVHNDKGCRRAQECIHKREPKQPTDPQYPKWWVSEWTMYRVFRHYEEFPPPYASPPAQLSPSDYQVSYGTSYYDATYVPADKDGTGAMMEFYDKFCLPIFPSANNYTCAFVSLGNKAYFLRYDDRPPDTPRCCQFSLLNHPPRRDFIKHLPYSPALSQHLDGSIQAYAREIGPQKILFGYSFYKTPASDGPGLPSYRHPQSFFFSGYPGAPPEAPIVSQNYTNFRATQPDPHATWAQVAQMCTPQPGWCCLFQGDCPDPQPADAGRPAAATWADLAPSKP